MSAVFLSYRDLEEMMAEHGVDVDYSPIAPRVIHFGPMLNELIRQEMRSEPVMARR